MTYAMKALRVDEREPGYYEIPPGAVPTTVSCLRADGVTLCRRPDGHLSGWGPYTHVYDTTIGVVYFVAEG